MFFAGYGEHRRKGQENAENGISNSELEAQIRQLKKENKRLLMEREILKKAAAIFANKSDSILSCGANKSEEAGAVACTGL